MANNRIDLESWQRRLEEYFSHDGIVGGKFLTYVMQREDEVGAEFVNKYHGHRVLIDSFQEFLFETLHLTFNNIAKAGWPQSHQNFMWVLLNFQEISRRFRASEILSTKGYAPAGYALLRDVKDEAFRYAAVFGGMMSLRAALGVEDIDPNASLSDREHNEIAKRKKRAETEIRERLIGRRSGFPENTQYELKSWDRLFHLQVHGSQLSFAEIMSRATKTSNLHIDLGPLPDIGAALYMNRCSELGWMLLRLLPFFQIGGQSFDDKWGKKWTIMDDSFDHMISILTELDKPIFNAILELMEKKFPFDINDYYSKFGEA